MSMNKEEARKLAFCRYMLDRATEESKAPGPFRWRSILTLHDAIEMFLHTAAEHCGKAPSRKTHFLQYWEVINKRLENGQLPEKPTMARLNRARVALKHHATGPDSQVIREYVASGQRLLEEGCNIVFQSPIADVSLIDFVRFEKVREKLGVAEKRLKEGEVFGCLKGCAEAFGYLVREFTNATRIGHRQQFLDSSHIRSLRFDLHNMQPKVLSLDGGTRREHSDFSRQVQEALETLRDSVEETHDVLRMLVFGVDLRKYLRFKSVVPTMVVKRSGDIVDFSATEKEKNCSGEEARFCLDFVVECAMRLQEAELEEASVSTE